MAVHFYIRVIGQIIVTIVLSLVYIICIFMDWRNSTNLYTKKERLFWTIYFAAGYIALTWYNWGIEFTVNGVIG